MDQGNERPADPVEPAEGPASTADEATEPATVSAASAPSRWDAPSRRWPGRRLLDAVFARDGSLQAGLRVGALVCLVGGGLSAALLAVPPASEDTVAAVRAPTMIASRSVPVEMVPARAPGPEQAAPALRYDATGTLRDLDLRGTASAFVRLVPEAPAVLCERFQAAGWATKGWSRSPLGGVQECLADRQFGAERKTSGFAVLRGAKTLSELRIKLNVTDPAARAEAARTIGDLIAAAFDRWHWDGARTLGDRIAALEPFDTVMLGTTVRLMREHGDVERWNLVLRFPTPPRPPEADPKTGRARTLAAFQAMADMQPPEGTPEAEDEASGREPR